MAFRDNDILDYIKQGKDNEALTEIYRSTLPKIRKYILQNRGTEDEVKDIFQDAIVIFYRKVKTSEFKEGSSIEAFIITIAKNLYINYVSRHLKRNVKSGLPEKGDETEDVLQLLIGKEKEILIDKIFGELGLVCSALLKLTVFNKLTMKEVAEKMGYLNEGVAKSKNYKCKQRLAKLVKNNINLTNIFKS